MNIIEKCMTLPEEIIISSLKPYQMSSFLISLLDDWNTIDQALRISFLILSNLKIFVALKWEGFDNIITKYKDNEGIMKEFGIDIEKAEK